jgi:hypothetical protein
MNITSIKTYLSKVSKNKALTEAANNGIALNKLTEELSKILGHQYEVTLHTNNPRKIALVIKYTSKTFNQVTHYILDFVMLMGGEYPSWKLVKQDALPSTISFPNIATRSIEISNQKLVNWFKINRSKLDKGYFLWV